MEVLIMKVFANGKVYVQNNDLQYLLRTCDGISIPSSIINKVFGDVFIVTDDNRYEFVEFSNPEDVDFFREYVTRGKTKIYKGE